MSVFVKAYIYYLFQCWCSICKLAVAFYARSRWMYMQSIMACVRVWSFNKLLVPNVNVLYFLHFYLFVRNVTFHYKRSSLSYFGGVCSVARGVGVNEVIFFSWLKWNKIESLHYNLKSLCFSIQGFKDNLNIKKLGFSQPACLIIIKLLLRVLFFLERISPVCIILLKRTWIGFYYIWQKFRPRNLRQEYLKHSGEYLFVLSL